MRYDLRLSELLARLSELLAVAVISGGLHYLGDLVGDYHAAASISAAITFGLTAAFGAMTLIGYRSWRLKWRLWRQK
jgi:zinc transporter ZupT